MANLDPRIIKVGLTIDGSVKWFTDQYISAKGTKFTSPNNGQCEITILNLARETREYLLRKTRLLGSGSETVKVVLEAGRESYGTSTIYAGDVYESHPTPAPNMGVRFKCITGY